MGRCLLSSWLHASQPHTSGVAPTAAASGEEKDPLYQILAEHLESFLQQARTSEHRLLIRVEKEMRA